MAYVDVNGLRLYLLDEGDGPAVVLLHGFPLDHSMWDAQRRALRDRYRVLIPDLRGFGRSQLGEDGLAMERFADDVAGLLDVVGVTAPVTLGGLSMGGCAALAFVRKYAARLSGLVLCDCRAVAESPEGVVNRRKLAETVLQDGPRVVVEAMMPRLFGPHTNERRPDVLDTVRNVMMATSSRTMAAAQGALADRPDCVPLLPTIAVPTLVVCGEHDVISPLAEMRQLAAAIPGAEFLPVPHAGHMSPMENPAVVTTALEQFVARTAIRS